MMHQQPFSYEAGDVEYIGYNEMFVMKPEGSRFHLNLSREPELQSHH